MRRENRFQLQTAVVATLWMASSRVWAQDTSHAVLPPNAERTDKVAQSSHAADSAAFTLVLANRQFLIPNRVVPGLKIQPAIGLQWRPRQALAIRIDMQSVDNSGPGRQGPFLAQRALSDSAGSGNFLQELTGGFALTRQAPYGIGGALQATLSLSHARRSYSLVDPSDGSVVERGNRSEAVPSASVRWIRSGPALTLSGGMSWAGFPNDNAMYLRRLPTDSTAFGNVFAATLASSWVLSQSFALEAQTSIPVSGNNSIRRGSGRLARVPVFELGGKWRANAATTVRLFATNSLGSAGPLAMVADREYVAVGAGVDAVLASAPRDPTHTPDWTPRREAYAASWVPALVAPSFMARAGVDGASVVASTAITSGLGVSVFGDHVDGTDDESELGGALTLSAFDRSRSQGARTRVLVIVAASHTNNVFRNFLEGDQGAFVRAGEEKRPIRFGREDDARGELYLITGGAALVRENDGGSVWSLIPLITTAQRRGVQVGGVLLSGGLPVSGKFDVRMDLGAALSPEGNALDGDRRRHVPAWEGGAAWRALPWLRLEAALGNRLGQSPFHQLRVRAGNRVGLSVGATMAR